MAYRRHYSKKVAQHVEWMGQFETLVNKALPSETGRIDWNSATYYRNTGLSPEVAAERYAASRRPMSAADIAARQADYPKAR